jgi:hypothetical protein
VVPFTPPSFKTHLYYISCLNQLSQNLKINESFNIKTKIPKYKNLKKKINLIRLIKKSFDEEYNMAKNNKDFAEVGSTWVAVKSYYLIFNMCLIAQYLIDGSEKSLDMGHRHLLENVKKLIKGKKIVFNKKIFNEFRSCSDALKFKLSPKESLKPDLDITKRVSSIFKKITSYKLINFQRDEKIENFRTKQNRKKKEEFLKNNDVNLCEFFYWYRIKVNYRDLDFLNEEISDKNFFDFYKNYYELTINFYNVLKDLVIKLSKKRLSKNQERLNFT